jgi:hypothetical protein
MEIEDRMAVVSAPYSPTQTLVDASVSIYSPADPDNVWQTGRTDKNGNFALVPDAEGEWMIVIDDQKGHMKTTTVDFASDLPVNKTVTEYSGTESAELSDNRLSNIYKIIIGLSLIIGITGFFYGLKARQARKTK